MATKGKKHQSQSEKAYYASYPTKAEKQRQARQNRHNKLHPNDTNSAGTSYRRQAPKSENGWATRRQEENCWLGAGSYGLTEQPSKAELRKYAQFAKFCKGVRNQMKYDKNKKTTPIKDQIENQLGYAEEVNQKSQ